MRKLAYFTLGFASASFACAACYGNWIFLAGIIMLIAAAAFGVLHKVRGIGRRALIVTLGCTVGLFWFLAYDHLFVVVPRVADGESGYVTIEASDYSMKTDNGASVEGRVVLAEQPYRVKAYLRQCVQLKPGDTVSGYFRFRLTTAGGKEDPTTHRTEGIFLLAYPLSDAEIVECEDIPTRYYPAKWRRDLQSRIDTILPENAAALAKALLLGDRTDISYEVNTALKVSGISHIIAVSGLHVSILFGLIYTLMARKRLLSCLVGIPILIIFAAVVGFTPSITRACVMQALMLIAMATDQEYDGKTALAFAVLLMLVINPMAIMSVSLQLSAGSVLGILLFSERIRNRILSEQKRKKRSKLNRRILAFIASSASVTLSAMVFTTPLVAYYFGTVSVVGILTNLLTLWVISFIFYGILFALAISIFSTTVGSWIGWILSIPIQFVLQVAMLLSKLPMAAVYTTSIYVVIWLIGCYFLLVLFVLQKKKRPAVFACCVFLSLLVAQAAAWTEPMLDHCRVTVMDVGQGQCILLQSDGKNFLVDCGGDDGKRAADTAAEMLLSQGISRLDGILVTHYDEDHAGGLPYLLTRIKTDRLILPYVHDESNVAQILTGFVDGQVQYVDSDVSYVFGSTQMTVIAPISYNTGNESSLCVLFRHEKCDILITGDRGELGEMMLLRGHKLPKLELLIAGHHGSSTSTGEELLSATMPEIVIISVGLGNRYGHPSEKTLQRLNSFGCRIYRTDLHGTVIFRR